MPLEKIGVYVPGGTANYSSSVLMNCIPAIVRCEKNLCNYSLFRQKINPGVLYAAQKCKVKKFIN